MVRSVWGGKKRLQQIDKVINADSWLGKTHIHTLTHTLTSSRVFFVVENVRTRANSFATLFWSSVCVCCCCLSDNNLTLSLGSGSFVLMKYLLRCPLSVAHFLLDVYVLCDSEPTVENSSFGESQFVIMWWLMPVFDTRAACTFQKVHCVRCSDKCRNHTSSLNGRCHAHKWCIEFHYIDP